MKFKAPRDKSTDAHLIKIRDVSASEGIACQAGSGECKELASESQDDGEGGEFFLCVQHAKEFADLAKLIAEMTPNQISAFKSSISEAEGTE